MYARIVASNWISWLSLHSFKMSGIWQRSLLIIYIFLKFFRCLHNWKTINVPYNLTTTQQTTFGSLHKEAFRKCFRSCSCALHIDFSMYWYVVCPYEVPQYERRHTKVLHRIFRLFPGMYPYAFPWPIWLGMIKCLLSNERRWTRREVAKLFEFRSPWSKSQFAWQMLAQKTEFYELNKTSFSLKLHFPKNRRLPLCDKLLLLIETRFHFNLNLTFRPNKFELKRHSVYSPFPPGGAFSAAPWPCLSLNEFLFLLKPTGHVRIINFDAKFRKIRRTRCFRDEGKRDSQLWRVSHEY